MPLPKSLLPLPNRPRQEQSCILYTTLFLLHLFVSVAFFHLFLGLFLFISKNNPSIYRHFLAFLSSFLRRMTLFAGFIFFPSLISCPFTFPLFYELPRSRLSLFSFSFFFPFFILFFFLIFPGRPPPTPWNGNKSKNRKSEGNMKSV